MERRDRLPCRASLLIALGLLASAGNALAALYRCEVDGRATFSDRPCVAPSRPVAAPERPATPQVAPAATVPPPRARLSAQEARRIQDAHAACVERGMAQWNAAQRSAPAATESRRKRAELAETCRKQHPIAPPDAVSASGGDAARLRQAIDAQDAGSVAILLRDGASPDVDLERGATGRKTGAGLPALSHAVHRGCITCTKVLLAAGADPNVPDRNGDYPLHGAIAGADRTVEAALVAALLNAGARTDTRNRRGETPADLARRLGRPESVGALQAAP